MRSRTFSIPAKSILLFALSGGGVAHAQSDATAEVLFRDGKRLLAEKHYDEACPKFAESARMAPSSGVQLALGLCYEAEGKTASAWGAYTAVIALARRDSRHDREKVAAAHAAALEPNVSRVTFTVDKATAGLTGLELRIDGIVLGNATWTGVPVDPGSHQVEVRAPGYVPYAANFTLGESGTEETLPVPALTASPLSGGSSEGSSGRSSTAFPAGESNASLHRSIGLATGGTGVAAIAVGAILGAVALGKVNDAEKACPSATCSNHAAVNENQSGGTFADASTGMVIAGGALAVTGVLFYVFGGPSHATSTAPAARVAPVVSPGYLGFRGTF